MIHDCICFSSAPPNRAVSPWQTQELWAPWWPVRPLRVAARDLTGLCVIELSYMFTFPNCRNLAVGNERTCQNVNGLDLYLPSCRNPAVGNSFKCQKVKSWGPVQTCQNPPVGNACKCQNVYKWISPNYLPNLSDNVFKCQHVHGWPNANLSEPCCGNACKSHST